MEGKYKHCKWKVHEDAIAKETYENLTVARMPSFRSGEAPCNAFEGIYFYVFYLKAAEQNLVLHS